MVIAANVSDITNLNVFIDAMLRLTPQERSVLHVEWYGCGSKKSCNSEVLENVNKEIQQKKIHLIQHPHHAGWSGSPQSQRITIQANIERPV